MHLKTRTWCLLSLIFLAGAFYFWRHGNEVRALRQQQAPAAATNQSASGPFPLLTRLAPGSHKFVRSRPAATAPAAAPAGSETNKFAFRLSNTPKNVDELSRTETGLLLRNALIDTAEFGRLEIPEHLLADADSGSYVVQADGPTTEAFRDRLAENGAEIVSYIPNNAYLVRASQASVSSLAAFAEIRAIVPYEPYFKLDPKLLPLAVAQKPMPAEGWLRVTVFSRTEGSATQNFQVLGAEVLSEQPSPFGFEFLVRPGAENLVALARMPEVQTIEPFYERVLLTDNTRVTLGISENTETGENHLGLTGRGVWVNLNDTGVDATHPDLGPNRVTSNDTNVLFDFNGHGTAMAGVIAGNGTASASIAGKVQGSETNANFRGMAPEARIYTLPLSFGPGTHAPVSDTYLQVTAARTNLSLRRGGPPFISNNSWGYNNANAYDSAAARFDAAVRDALPGSTNSQSVIYVFGAGNSGGGADDGLGGIADTILSPATAKNVITVSASEILRTFTNFYTTTTTGPGGEEIVITNTPFLAPSDSDDQIAAFSGRGNVGIGDEGEYGRFKPDVTAPGAFMVTARSTNFSLVRWFEERGFDTNAPIFQLFDDIDGEVAPAYRYELGGGSTRIVGSSPAAAAVSGTLALMQEFFEQRVPAPYRRTNSPALMKALLINGARSLDPRYDFQVQSPINHQGWGMIGLPNMITPLMLTRPPAEWPVQMVDQGTNSTVATDEVRRWNLTLSTNAQFAPLKITLAWTDPAGNPNAGIKLVNDLDLILSNSVTHQVYYGNDIPAASLFNSASESNSPPVLDNVNNVENVFVREPTDTNFVIYVVGRRVNVQGVSTYFQTTRRTNDVAQDFALVVSTGELVLTNAFSLTAVQDTPALERRPATVMTNGIPLLKEHVGANAALQNLRNGTTNQWNFYVFTNIYIPNDTVNMTNGTNVAFVTFLPPNLSRSRNLEADIDIYVSTNAGLLNLDRAVVSNAFTSVGRGGTEYVVFTNAAIGDVFYIGIKSEDQQASEFGFIALSSDVPFDANDNGSRVLRAFPLSVNIPDGSALDPGGVSMIALGISPNTVQRVTVTNWVVHENFGDLIGLLNHDNTTIALNNHRIDPNGATNAVFIYDDNEFFPIGANVIRTDGPGSLNDFAGLPSTGVWLFNMVDSGRTQTGRVESLTLRVDPLIADDLGAAGSAGLDGTVEGNSVNYYYMDVPSQATNMIITLSEMTGPLNMYIRWRLLPTPSEFDKAGTILPPGGDLNLSAFDQPYPLIAGRYYIALQNTNAGPVDFHILGRLQLGLADDSNRRLSPTNAFTLIDNALTVSTVDLRIDRQVTDLEVAVRIDHPRMSDLVLTLVSPQGTRLLLAENRGGRSGQGYGEGYGSNLFYSVFTEDTNRLQNLLPVKFITPPFTNLVGGTPTNFPVVADGFEDAAPGLYPSNSVIARGWTVTRGAASVETNLQGITAYEGTNFLRLDTNGAPASIIRDFETVPGRDYLVRFAYHRNPRATPQAAHALSVYFGPEPTPATPVDPDKFVAVNFSHWSQTGLVFRATSARTFLEISSLTSSGPLIDGIEVWDAVTLGDRYMLPEEPFDFVRGERAMGEWRLEIQDTRAGPNGAVGALLDWQLRLEYGQPRGRAFSLNEFGAVSGIIYTNQTNYFVMDVCHSARILGAVLAGARGKLNLLIDHSGFPNGDELDDYFAIPNFTVVDDEDAQGYSLFFHDTNPAHPAPLQPGKQIFFAVHNIDPNETNEFVFSAAVDRDECAFLRPVIRLTNEIPYTNVIGPSASFFQYYVYTASCAPGTLTLDVEPQNGDVGLVVRKGPVPPLPDTLIFDYSSNNPGVTNEVIVITTNSAPVMLEPGDDWYLGVYNLSSTPVVYTVTASEVSSGATNLIGNTFTILPNGVTITNTQPYCPQLTNYFHLAVTNPATSVQFSLTNVTQPSDVFIARNLLPNASNFLYSVFIPAVTGAVDVAFTPTNNLPELEGDWYVRVIPRAPTSVTIVITGSFVPGLSEDCDLVPDSDLTFEGASTNGICWSWPTVSGRRYRFEIRTNIADTAWIPMATITGTGARAQYCVPPMESAPFLFAQVVEECDNGPITEVEVEPVDIRIVSTNLCLSWNSIAGFSYRVEQTTNFFSNPPPWQVVTNVVAVTNRTEVCIPAPTVFTIYRVMQEGRGGTNQPIITLTNAIAYSSSITTSTNLDYYLFTVSTNAGTVTFELAPENGNLQLLVSKGPALPDVLNFDYRSDNPGTSSEVIVVTTNSTVALTPGDWHLGVFNPGTNTVNYFVRATEMAEPIVALTNAVAHPVTALAANGVRYFSFNVSSAATNATFETLLASANVDLYVKRGLPLPSAADFDYASPNVGTANELVTVRTTGVPPLQQGVWFLAVTNVSGASASFSARASEFLAQSSGGEEVEDVGYSVSTNGLCLAWTSIIGRTYQVESNPDIFGGSWTLLQSVTAVATNTQVCLNNPPPGFFRVILAPVVDPGPGPTSGEVTNVTSSVTGTNVCFSWPSTVDQSYQVESKADIAAPWTLELRVVATGPVTTFCAETSAAAAFYRVLIESDGTNSPVGVEIVPEVRQTPTENCLSWPAEAGSRYRVEGLDPGPAVFLYDSAVTNINRGYFLAANGMEIGDQVALEGTNGIMDEILIDYYASANLNGNESLVLRFWNNDGATNQPGTLIYDPLPIDLQGGTVSGFNTLILGGLGGLPLPSSFTWSLEFQGLEGTEQMGLFLSEAREGASQAGFWQRLTTNSAWGFSVSTNGSALSARFVGVSRDGTNWTTITNVTSASVTNELCLPSSLAYRYFRVFKDSGSSTNAGGGAAPAFASAALVSGNALSMSWNVTPGASYQVQLTTNLFATPVVWTPVMSVTATNSPLSVSLPVSTNLMQFYRLVQP